MLGCTERGIVHCELLDGYSQIEAGVQRITRQVNRSKDTATRDDVIVAQRGQSTGPIHEHDETGSLGNDVKRTPEQRSRGEACVWRLPRGRRHLSRHAAAKTGNHEDCAQEAERLAGRAHPDYQR